MELYKYLQLKDRRSVQGVPKLSHNFSGKKNDAFAMKILCKLSTTSSKLQNNKLASNKFHLAYHFSAWLLISNFLKFSLPGRLYITTIT